MKTRLLSALTLVVLLALVGCTTSPEPTPEAAELHLKVEVNMDADGEVVLRFGAHNMGPADFPGDEDFVGKWELTDEAGALRASGSLTIMGLLGAGKTAFPAEWKSELVPGAYTLTWSAADYDSIVVHFTIVERDGKLSIGEQVTHVFDDYEPQATPDEGDYGEAQPLMDLVIADLAERLGVSSDEIAVQSVETTEFPDASLGVPEPGKVYAQVITPGYVIQLVVDDAMYEYHGSGDRVVFAPTSSSTPAPVYQEVNIPEAGLVFEVPAGWLRLEPECAWAPDNANSLRLGFNWMDIQPPQEVEAAMLPHHSQIIHSEPVELDWASGRSFTVEVYAPAAQGDDTRAPVQSVEIHVLIVVSLGDTRRAFDFYASGQTAEQLAILEPSLQHMLETSILTD